MKNKIKIISLFFLLTGIFLSLLPTSGCQNLPVVPKIPGKDTLVFDTLLTEEIPDTTPGKITGLIIDDDNINYKIGGAKITLIGTSISDTTNQDGIFILNNCPQGTQSILIEHPNFMSKIVNNIDVLPRKTTSVGNVGLRDLYVDGIVDDSNAVNPANVVGWDESSSAKVSYKGYLVVDMGKDEEIVNGDGKDFEIKWQGGYYTTAQIFISNYPDTFWTLLAQYDFNRAYDPRITSFDITLPVARYIKIKANEYGQIYIYFIKVINYK